MKATVNQPEDVKDSLCNGESLLPADTAQLDEYKTEFGIPEKYAEI